MFPSFYRVLLAAGLLSLLLADTAVCQSAKARPNILWINAEDMSPHLGCYGHPDAVTPNIDRLANSGILYRNAFATAPICSPSRSCLATGLYATSLGTQHLRCEVEIPDRVAPLANRLREHGYFCTNTGKSDYNFSPDGIWDAWSSDLAPWRARSKGQPFFGFITVGETHEGRINTRERYEQATAKLPDVLRHDPDSIAIPPFYPDTPEIRRIFARMHDLATVFDLKVEEILEALREDGDLDNTFVFVFGDHGNGLPRYKRWLNDSGLRVPLVVSIPANFRHLTAGVTRGASDQDTGVVTDRLVSFVDFPATALSLAGIAKPSILQGEAFLGEFASEPRKYVFGARSRADDMFEVSRSVSDGRYFYVRHFMPHLPYIQRSVIFGDRKDSLRELRKLHEAGELNVHAERMWAERKPIEELYDLERDPNELHNLAASTEHQSIKQRLSTTLKGWILSHRDSGFLPEAEYQIRAAQSSVTPFDVVQNRQNFDLEATLEAAWRVGQTPTAWTDLAKGMTHAEPGVRYWSVVACQAAGGRATSDRSFNFQRVVRPLLNDDSPSVAIAAAEALLSDDEIGSRKEGAGTNPVQREALGRLVAGIQDDRPWVRLQAARSLAMVGKNAESVVPEMIKFIRENLAPPGSNRTYKDFNYTSFTGWALESALIACGETEFVDRLNR